MSQNLSNGLQLSGEAQSSGSTTYSLEKYLHSDGGLTERLLKELNVGGIVGRAQVMKNEVDMLARRVSQPSQDTR